MTLQRMSHLQMRKTLCLLRAGVVVGSLPLLLLLLAVARRGGSRAVARSDPSQDTSQIMMLTVQAVGVRVTQRKVGVRVMAAAGRAARRAASAAASGAAAAAARKRVRRVAAGVADAGQSTTGSRCRRCCRREERSR
jgi:hypothetical protein